MPEKLRHTKTTNRSFCIGATNDISLITSELPKRTDGVTFSSERELSLRTARWSGSRLVQVWNRLPNLQPVKKFTDRRTAIHRIWRAIQEGHVNRLTDAGTQTIASNEARRPNTKSAHIIKLLQQPAGATLQSLMDLTGWQAHSVRGFLSAQLSKKRGLRIESFVRDGDRVYRIGTRAPGAFS
jgi:Protein of unknown function (DUF3489)